MIGCCGCEAEKFKSSMDEVDERRLAVLVERLKVEGCTPEQIERVRQCDCGCHVDGLCVLC